MFYDNLDPIIYSFHGIQIRWYGVVYVLAFLTLYFYLLYLTKSKQIFNFDKKDVEPFLIGLIISMIIGARLFHCFIYYPNYYFKNFFEIFMIWKGGLSFHGALLFVTFWIYYFCKKKKIWFLELTDYLVFPAALFLALGRIANFANGELVGKITNVSWGVDFNNSETYRGVFRHPTQIYESIKNLFLFGFLLCAKYVQGHFFRKYTPGLMTAIFLLGYGFLRFFLEFLKESVIVAIGLNMGQILSIFVFILGLYIAYHLYKTKKQFSKKK